MMLNILFCHTKKNEALGYKQVPQNDEKPVYKTWQGKLGLRLFCPIKYYLTSLKMMKAYKIKRICIHPLSHFCSQLTLFLTCLIFLWGNYNTSLASTCNM